MREAHDSMELPEKYSGWREEYREKVPSKWRESWC